MNRKTALEILGDGHTIWSVKAAQEVCDNVGVRWLESLAKQRYSHKSPMGQKHDVNMEVEGEMTVDCYDLTQHVMTKLGVEPSHIFNGRGSQAQHNAQVIKQALARRDN